MMVSANLDLVRLIYDTRGRGDYTSDAWAHDDFAMSRKSSEHWTPSASSSCTISPGAERRADSTWAR
jgi:hypothetical protein